MTGVNSTSGNGDRDRGPRDRAGWSSGYLRCGLILLILAIVVVPDLEAGKSLVWDGNSKAISGSNVPDNKDLRLELQLHDFVAPSGTRTVAWLDLFDFQITAYSNNVMIFTHRKGGSCLIAIDSGSHLLIRVQVTIAEGRVDCEVWNVDGTGYRIVTSTGNTFGTFTSDNGSLPGFNSGQAYLGFVRGFTELVPLKSRPPVTADVGTYFDWKLDGNGSDSSGKGNTLGTGGASFVDTPGQRAYSLPQTVDTPVWAPFRPLRAGFPNQLDGSTSYSMADASAAVTCVWQQVPHGKGEPLTSKARFLDRNVCKPEVEGLVFGPYRFRLEVTDSAGGKNVADLEAGAVAYDENGVVIYPDERLKLLLGETKVVGSNDSEWYDERQFVLGEESWKNYEVNGGTWMLESQKAEVNGIPRLGTVYVANGSNKLYGVGANLMTVLCGGRPGPPLSTNTPLRIFIKSSRNRRVNGRLNAIASCESENEITLTGGYDQPTVENPGVDWGTFGLAEIRGDVKGTVYTNPSATTKLYGVGTDFLRLCGGASGSAPTPTRVLVIEDNLVTRRNVASCQSDTEITLTSAWGPTHIASPGVSWRWDDPSLYSGEWRPNQTSNINYYDIALGHYRLYYATGGKKARDSARWLAYNWSKRHDEWYVGRELSFTGMVLLFTVDSAWLGEGEVASFWDKLKPWAHDHVITRSSCASTRIGDLRENTYCLGAISWMALYHPEAEEREKWRNRIVFGYENSYGTQQQEHGQYFNQDSGGDSTRTLRVTQGSATVTLHAGPEFDADYCGDVSSYQESGTVSATKGSAAISGTGTSFTGGAGKRILIRGTREGVPWSQISNVLSVESATALTLKHPWHGDSGSGLKYRIVTSTANNSPYLPAVTLGMMQVDASGSPLEANLVERGNWYWCTVDSGTQLTLDKPFTGDTSATTYRRIAKGTPGRGAQPFMQGIAAWNFHIASAALDGHNDPVAAGYRARANAIVDYLYRYAARKMSLPYLTDYEPCLPRDTAPNICDDFGIATGRSYMVETNRAFTLRYLMTRDEGDRAMGDAWYTAQYSRSGFAARFASDGDSAGLLQSSNWVGNANLITKNYGQTFGVGGGHTWPAARVGGAAAPVIRQSTVSCKLEEVPGSVGCRVLVQLPSGSTKSATCANSPCAVDVDTNQGIALLQREYLDGNGKVLARSEPDLLKQQ